MPHFGLVDFCEIYDEYSARLLVYLLGFISLIEGRMRRVASLFFSRQTFD